MEEGAHLGHLSYRPALGLGISAPPPCFRVLFGKVQQCSILRYQTTGDLNPINCKFYLCPPPHLFFQQYMKKSFFKGTFGLFGGHVPLRPPLGSGTAEDRWSCKRSPDVWAQYKYKTYKTWIKMAEQTLTLITHNPSFTHSV